MSGVSLPYSGQRAYLAVWMGAKLWRAACSIAGRNVEAAGAKALRRQRMLNIVGMCWTVVYTSFQQHLVMHL